MRRTVEDTLCLLFRKGVWSGELSGMKVDEQSSRGTSHNATLTPGDKAL